MLFAVVVTLLLVFLNWYVAPTKPSEKKDLVLALAQILGGTALLSGLYFTWRTLQVNREGQITERFTSAIDQLGKVEDGKKLFEIRVGGIYALERIARESEEDYEPIMEVLTAYVRQNAPLDPEREKDEEGSYIINEERTTDPADIQAVMTVLRRLTRSHGKGESKRLDLHETDLYEANLSGANLSGANLSGANLFRANLSNVDLTYADLTHADLTNANLVGAVLSHAVLPWAALLSAELYRANLYRANLFVANLSVANLPGVDLTHAFLAKANLSDAHLSGANLSGVDLSDADLSRADLAGANLFKAVHLTQGQLERARGDKSTKLPPDLKPPAWWDLKTDELIEGS
jgi:uncharacterized protein YjbI with pentapeptide repeats